MAGCTRVKKLTARAALFVESVDVGAQTCAAARVNQNHIVQMIEIAQVDL